MSVGLGVFIGDDVIEGKGLAVWVGVSNGVAVGGGDNVNVALGTAVPVGELVTETVTVKVAVEVWVGELVRVREGKTVGVLVSVHVGVACSAICVSSSVGDAATVGVCGESMFRPQPANSKTTIPITPKA